VVRAQIGAEELRVRRRRHGAQDGDVPL
jgi:hypothetical protein